jgi:hypothetical protein
MDGENFRVDEEGYTLRGELADHTTRLDEPDDVRRASYIKNTTSNFSIMSDRKTPKSISLLTIWMARISE